MIVVRSPLRVSFTGGGTDFPEYFNKKKTKILTTSINKYVYIILKKREDSLIYLNYSSKEIIKNSKYIKHEIFKAVLNYFNMKNGIEISVLSDIPSKGSGLGSSSSFTAALIKACSIYKKVNLNKKKLAELTCKVEIEILKKPIGIQDQYAICMGGLNVLTLSQKGINTVTINNKKITNILKNNSVLFNLNMPRTADSVLSKHSKLIHDNKINLDSINNNSNYIIKKIDEISKEDFCNSINKGWELKKRLVENVTNILIEKEILKAKKMGCIGYKVCGAGNGGYLLLIFKNQKHRNSFFFKYEKRCLKVEVESEGVKVIYLSR